MTHLPFQNFCKVLKSADDKKMLYGSCEQIKECNAEVEFNFDKQQGIQLTTHFA